MAILVHLVQSHQRGQAAAQGFVPPAVDRRPTRKGRRLKGKSTGGRTEQASNTARGTPGSPAPRGDDLLCTPTTLCVHRLRGALGFPAFRAPSSFEGRRPQNSGAIECAARTILFVCIPP